MSDYQSYRVLAGRVRMHVLDWPGGDPPIVFLHGYSNNALAALRFGKLLEGRRRLIAPDLRGRGHTDMPFGEYGVKVHVKDVMTCLDRMKVEHFVASGHSLGATVSVFMAAQYPERVAGLILFDGGAVPSESGLQTLNAYYDTITYRYTSADDYVGRFKNAPTYQPWTDDLEALVRSNLFQQPDGTYIRRVPRYVIDADRRAEHLETWNQLPELYPKVQCPVLILRAGLGMMGIEDQMLSDDAIAAMLAGMPSAHVVTIPQAGHTSLLTIPNEERDKALIEFLGLPL